MSLRSWDEFTGKISGYTYIKRTGEPKGATWGHADRKVHNMEDYLNADGTVIDLTKMTPEWAKWGVNKDNEIAFYCGTGWRATLPWLLAYQAGWQHIKLYDGGWYMWQQDPSLPIQKGDPRNAK